MLAVLGFAAFAIAGILHLVSRHADVAFWLVIFGGLLVCADVAWTWRGRRVPPGG